jgi:hypothetical protein
LVGIGYSDALSTFGARGVLWPAWSAWATSRLTGVCAVVVAEPQPPSAQAGAARTLKVKATAVIDLSIFHSFATMA